MDYCQMVDEMRAQGYSDNEINNEIGRARAEAESEFYENYYNDHDVQYGWHQQDIIDMYRRER